MSKSKKNKIEIIDSKVNELNRKISDYVISNLVKDNIADMKKLFVNDDTFEIREIESSGDGELKYAIAYCPGLVNSSIINENIIKPLTISKDLEPGPNLIDELSKRIILIDGIKKTNKMTDIIENVTYGDVILFIDGVSEVLILNAKRFDLRSVEEPENEKILSGPREGFTESLIMNLSMVRRKLRTNELKFKYLTFGDKTNTQACVCYIDSIVDKNILKEVFKRLKKIKIDGMIDTNYITEFTRDNPFSPFRATGYTERPDTITGKLLEGHIAIFLDGTPAVLSVPYFFTENFQNSEEYYLNFYYTSFTRILRIIGFFFTVAVPALYVGIIAFHREMLPTPLFINIAMSRQNVPLPASIEAFIMLVVFDILRETGLRMPSNIGQALSIVGAIVIGQAAVDAKLVSSPMIIVVAFSGITGLLIPKLNAPIIFIRILLLMLSSTFGLFGFIVAFSLIVIHILNLKSYGISQVNPKGNFKFQNNKDTLIRAPWWKMIKRPQVLTSNRTRMKQVGGK